MQPTTSSYAFKIFPQPNFDANLELPPMANLNLRTTHTLVAWLCQLEKQNPEDLPLIIKRAKKCKKFYLILNRQDKAEMWEKYTDHLINMKDMWSDRKSKIEGALEHIIFPGPDAPPPPHTPTTEDLFLRPISTLHAMKETLEKHLLTADTVIRLAQYIIGSFDPIFQADETARFQGYITQLNKENSIRKGTIERIDTAIARIGSQRQSDRSPPRKKHAIALVARRPEGFSPASPKRETSSFRQPQC